MLKLGHKNLEIWKKSLKLVVEIYKLTDKLPVEERYGITSQIRRAVVSMPSNISEGASRSSQKERKRFYEIARSSLVELDTQLEILLTLKYLRMEELEDSEKDMNEIFAMITAMKAKT
jgi:four helix bundle protein